MDLMTKVQGMRASKKNTKFAKLSQPNVNSFPPSLTLKCFQRNAEKQSTLYLCAMNSLTLT